MAATLETRRRSGTTTALARIGAGVAALAMIAILPAGAEAQQPGAYGVSDAPRVTRVEAELANACVESGRPKRLCVCEVRLLRVSVDPHDYGPSALLQTAAYRKSLPAARLTLSQRGVSAPEVKALDAQRRKIVRERLEPTCARVGVANAS